MNISNKGLALIKRFEGLRLRAYRCPAGVWTIGYGSTGPHVRQGLVITEAEANDLLRRDLVRFEQGVLNAIRPKTPLQEEFDAMVSLAFNIGVAAFARSSVARRYKAGDKVAAANAFGMWVKAGGRTLPGLVTRRAAEKQLFLSASGTVRPVERPVSANKTVTVPEESVVPDASSERPLSRSREVIGGGVVAAGSGASILNSFTVENATEVRSTVQQVGNDSNQGFMQRLHIPEIASALALLIGIFIIWKRIKDRNKGIR